MKRALLVLVLLASCSSPRRGEPIAGAFRTLDESVERGQMLFSEHCYKCHPGGEAGLGPALNNKPLPVFLMRLQVRRGLGAMPSIPDSALSDEELDDLLEFVVALRKQG